MSFSDVTEKGVTSMIMGFSNSLEKWLSSSKIILFSGLFMLAVAFAGCSARPSANPSNEPANLETVPASQEPLKESSSSPSGEQTGNEDTPKEWKLVWSDEFEGDNDASVDGEKWVIEIGNNKGWGNNELQYYTDSTENASLQDGSLVIKAIKEEKEGFHYTSARLKTKGKFEFQYGKVEMSAKLPYGMGIWPAFWMLGSDIDTISWPDCGEIDIMEYIGRRSNIVFGTLHGPEYNGAMGLQNSITTDEDLHDTFHTYAVEWDADSIHWYFDGKPFHKVMREKLPTTYTWAFDKKFFVLVNLAVGGNWPQNPNDTTKFPQTYVIDYIRVYQ